ncbi:MAG TPA: HEAT repeat domain-containing protein, partial [Elusimicrobiales bacterium]|nr:HEAT repeat domain-containing protein [Elusimicrobiales bacterium]
MGAARLAGPEPQADADQPELRAEHRRKNREILKGLLQDKDARVKTIAAKGLARDGDAAVYPELEEALDGADDNARLHAIEGMASLKDARAEKRLIALLKHTNRDVRWKAAEALGNFKGR